MAYSPYDPNRKPAGRATGPARLVLGLAVLGVVAAVGLGIVSASVGGVQVWRGSLMGGGSGEDEKVSRLEFPAELLTQVASPKNDTWLLPDAAVVIDDAIYVCDVGNNRVLKMDAEGNVLQVLGELSASGHQLRPAALATDGQRLAIASALTSEIAVVNQSGELERTVRLAARAPGDVPARPIGVALRPDGGIVASDADNQRVLIMDAAGQVTAEAGTGSRSADAGGFNVPGGVALDPQGNIYVVDVLNARVVKLAPHGVVLQQFGTRGQTVGALSRPKGVAVDTAGRVYVSDGLLAAVLVFGPDGKYLGLIGRKTPGEPGLGSLFQAPAGLFIKGDVLYVVDRFKGLLLFRLPAPAAEAPQTGP